MSDPIASLVEHLRVLRTGRPIDVSITEVARAKDASDAQIIRPAGIPSQEAFGLPSVVVYPDLLLQAAVVNLGDKEADGQLVRGVSVPWFEIVRQLDRDPQFLSKVDWRKLEEIIAAAYHRDGWPEVILTPRSGDRGRDIIATRPGIGSIRIIDQVKAYPKKHKVTADEVRSVLGVLSADRNVSKGIITTTSTFAPGIIEDPDLRAFMPNRLELRDGTTLAEWLKSLLPESR